MQTIWHIRGAKAGTFESVGDEKAKEAIASGDAQIADGLTPLEPPEGHPDYKEPAKTSAPAPAGPGRPKKKYQNKMETTDEE